MINVSQNNGNNLLRDSIITVFLHSTNMVIVYRYMFFSLKFTINIITHLYDLDSHNSQFKQFFLAI